MKFTIQEGFGASPIAVALGLSLFCNGIQAQVTGFQIGKNAQWMQTSASPAFTDENAAEYSVDAGVFFGNSAERIGIVSNGQTSSELILSGSGTGVGGGVGFSTRAELDAAFPDGATYRFDLTGGPESGSFGTLSFDAPPAGTIPAFQNYEAIQSINPNEPFRFEWNAWTGAAGAGSYIPYELYEVNGPLILGGGISSAETGFTLDAMTLEPGKTYRFGINFSSGQSGAGTDWEGSAIGWNYWNYRTTVQFVPIPEVDGRLLTALGLAVGVGAWRRLRRVL